MHIACVYWYSPAYCLEFLPAKTRAATYCLLEVRTYKYICAHLLSWKIQFAWAGGAIMEALLALVVMTHLAEHGWRWLLGFSALPIGFLLLILPVRIGWLTGGFTYIVLLLVFSGISTIFDYKGQGG